MSAPDTFVTSMIVFTPGRNSSEWSVHVIPRPMSRQFGNCRKRPLPLFRTQTVTNNNAAAIK